MVSQQFSGGNQSVAASQSLIYAMLQGLQQSAVNSANNSIMVGECNNVQTTVVCEDGNMYHANPALH
uniref:Uncharacterized protein n=1 Tax=Ditylenchus dipsaci TaxID=166011 RepID=A0A915END6_9BILA